MQPKKYQDFIASKALAIKPVGFDCEDLNSNLFPFQREIVRRSLKLGKSCVFAGCGLGKSLIALSWADAIVTKEQRKVLIVAPLAVGIQLEREAIKFGVVARFTKIGSIDPNDRIVITNYENLHKFSATDFIGVVLDESSIIKACSSATRNQIIEMFARTEYKLACTATPSPNDYMELGNHAEFIGIMSRVEMLATFFTHDGGDTSKWRLKGHAESKFWQWVNRWAIAIEKPSNLGYSNDGYDLPPLNYFEHKIEASLALESGQLFKLEAAGLLERRTARRNSLNERVAKCAELVNSSDEQWLVWCDLNDEGDLLERSIADSVQIAGRHSDEFKESAMLGFIEGKTRVLISKPSICGFGINFQNCRNIAFVGLSDSYESLHQSVRRCWRFGQTKSVNCHLIIASTEGAVLRNLKRKENDFNNMTEQLASNINLEREIDRVERDTADYKRKVAKGSNWELHLGDCVDVAKEIDSESIDYSIFSPPFASLYTYSNSDRDMGNCRSSEEFIEHFRFLVDELHRIIKPGRLVSFHCMNLPMSKQNDGEIGLKDFRGDLIRLFQDAGFIYHSEVVIWKDPVIAMQRTKAIGLLHKQLEKDSTISRQGIPDYLVTMRKKGVNANPVAGKLDRFVGENPPLRSVDEKRTSIDIWQRYASPVWTDINPSRTLQKESARENDDERHVCLARNSLILTYHKGYVPIQDIEVGKDLVLTHKGRWMPVIAKSKTSDSAEVVSIDAGGVSGLTVTPDHKLWTRTCDLLKSHFKQQAMQSNPQWIEAKDLKNQYVNFQLPPTEESELTESEWWIVGRWLADGHLATGTTGRTSLHISVGSHKIEEFMQFAGNRAGTTHQTGNTCVQVRIKDPDRKLRKILDGCGKKAYEKQIPPSAFRLPREQAKALLDGFLSGDGHYLRKRKRWTSSSTSKKLLLGVQALVLRVYGVTSALYRGKPDRQTIIQGRVVNCHQEWILSFQSHGYQFGFVLDDGAWKKVKSVNTAGRSETWNIQVLEDASYTAEGCIVKNCPLQLDIVERALQLWTNPNDLIFSPFTGIGSEGYVSIEVDRRFIGAELKESYFNCAVSNLQSISNSKKQLSLFA